MVEASGTTRLSNGGALSSISELKGSISNGVNSVLNNGSTNHHNGSALNKRTGSFFGNVRSLGNGSALTGRNNMGVENVRSITNGQSVEGNTQSPNGYSNGSIYHNGYNNGGVRSAGVMYGPNLVNNTTESPEIDASSAYRRGWTSQNEDGAPSMYPPHASCNNFGGVNGGANEGMSVRTMSNGVLNRSAGSPNRLSAGHLQTLPPGTMFGGVDRTYVNNNASCSDIPSRQPILNYSINENIVNNPVIDYGAASNLNKNNHPNHRITPGGVQCDSNHSSPNTNIVHYNNTNATTNPDPKVPALTRNSSNNSSTASSRNSHPSSSNNSHANRQHIVTNTTSTIQGILRYPNNENCNDNGHVNGTMAMGSNTVSGSVIGNNVKVVRIDPHGYPLREGPSVGMSRHPSDRAHSKNNSGSEDVNQRLHGSQRLAKTHNSRTSVNEATKANQASNKVMKSSGPSEEISRADSLSAEEKNRPLTPADELRKASSVGDLGKIQTLLGKPPGNAAGAALVNQLDEVSFL